MTYNDILIRNIMSSNFLKINDKTNRKKYRNLAECGILVVFDDRTNHLSSFLVYVLYLLASLKLFIQCYQQRQIFGSLVKFLIYCLLAIG